MTLLHRRACFFLLLFPCMWDRRSEEVSRDNLTSEVGCSKPYSSVVASGGSRLPRVHDHTLESENAWVSPWSQSLGVITQYSIFDHLHRHHSCIHKNMKLPIEDRFSVARINRIFCNLHPECPLIYLMATWLCTILRRKSPVNSCISSRDILGLSVPE